jgi:hypothetical protein
MAVLRFARFTIQPGTAEDLLARRAALVAAVRAAFPGLIKAELAQLGDDTWIDVWRWDSPSSAQAAGQAAPAMPEVAAAFSVTRGLTLEQGEVVDER